MQVPIHLLLAHGDTWQRSRGGDAPDRAVIGLIAILTILAFWRYCRKQLQDSAPTE